MIKRSSDLMQNITDRCSPLVSKSLPIQDNTCFKRLILNEKKESECLKQ